MKRERLIVLLFTYIIGPIVFLYLIITTLSDISRPVMSDDVAGFLRATRIMAIRVPHTAHEQGVLIITQEGWVNAPYFPGTYVASIQLEPEAQEVIHQVYQTWCAQAQPFTASDTGHRYRIALRCGSFNYRDGYLSFEELPPLLRDLLRQLTPPDKLPTTQKAFLEELGIGLESRWKQSVR